MYHLIESFPDGARRSTQAVDLDDALRETVYHICYLPQCASLFIERINSLPDRLCVIYKEKPAEDE